MEKQIQQVLRMNGGTDETSFSKASYMAKQILSMTKSIKEKAIRELYNCLERPTTTTLCIADLGCSSSEKNSLSVISELIQTIDEARRRLGRDEPKEYQIYLNDLPGNDFNTLFGCITSFENELKQKVGDDFGHCFVNGVPGSFYGRLFPFNSLHFVHSSTSLHWLSQVPDGIEDNNRNIYMSRTSPPSVLKAYHDQFQKDFLMFLQSRSKEVVVGGKMVLTLLGRQNNDPCYTKDSTYMWDLLAKVLNDMVFEGYIEKEKLHKFNIAIYTPSPSELGFLVEKEGSFALNQVHVFQVSWEANDHKINNGSSTNTFDLYDFTTCMRSVVEPLIIAHFGEAVIEEVFKRYREITQISLAQEKNMVTNVTISLTRKSRG